MNNKMYEGGQEKLDFFLPFTTKLSWKDCSIQTGVNLEFLCHMWKVWRVRLLILGLKSVKLHYLLYVLSVFLLLVACRAVYARLKSRVLTEIGFAASSSLIMVILFKETQREWWGNVRAFTLTSIVTHSSLLQTFIFLLSVIQGKIDYYTSIQ